MGGEETSAGGFGDDEPTSTGLRASKTSSAAEETETLVDPESTETGTARVTKTTSQDDSEETSSAEPEQNDSTAEDTAALETTTRRPSGTQTRPAPTQSTGAADALVAPMGGLLAAAVGFVALL